MSTRAASWLALSLGLMSVALLSASTVLLVLNRPTRVVESAGVWGTANVPFIFLVVTLDFTLVGALVASRRPTNPIGWISLAAGLALALFNAAGEYAIYALLSQPGFALGRTGGGLAERMDLGSVRRLGRHLPGSALPRWTSALKPLAGGGGARRCGAGLLEPLEGIAPGKA